MEFISGNVFIRPMAGDQGAPVGFKVDGHTHNFEHTSIFFTGRWRVKRWKKAVSEDGVQLTLDSGKPAWILLDDFERDAPFYLLIEAECRHEFVFLGHPIPTWMESFISKMDDAPTFRDQYNKSLGQAWCVYSHRSPRGDVTEHQTGWYTAYA